MIRDSTREAADRLYPTLTPAQLTRLAAALAAKTAKCRNDLRQLAK
jgi:hypothetical protein